MHPHGLSSLQILVATELAGDTAAGLMAVFPVVASGTHIRQ